MIYGIDIKNPIEAWFETPRMIDCLGTLACLKMKRKCLETIPLDPEKDEMPADWVIDIITERLLSFAGRIKILTAHCENIARAKGLKIERQNYLTKSVYRELAQNKEQENGIRTA